eukprot:6466825-Amphidinium_carterae.1
MRQVIIATATEFIVRGSAWGGEMLGRDGMSIWTQRDVHDGLSKRVDEVVECAPQTTFLFAYTPNRN